MKRLWLLLGLLVPLMVSYAAPQSASKAIVLEIDGPIGPAVADYVTRGIKQAHKSDAALVILRIDTPGGLDLSMRTIIQGILSSPVPVVSYVAPSGSRAASAGTYILYASHIAAMAPATNLGAATPVRIGGVPGMPEQDKDKKDKPKNEPASGDAMEKKIINDAVAYIKGLARLRGRNVEWAEKAVREGVSLPVDEALKLNVIDVVARDMDELLIKIDGRKVSVEGRKIALRTKGLERELIEPGWRYEFLAVITNPTIVPILMMLGVLGLMYELWNPGFVLPGVIGGICLLLALYAIQVLPVSYAGLALILLGISFMVAEAFMPSFGALGIGGVIAFVAGSIMLLDTDVEGFGVYVPAIVAVGVTGAVLTGLIAAFALKARQRSVVSGSEEMLGAMGKVIDAFDGEGRIRVHSEDWRARSKIALQAGQTVRVVNIDGLLLDVEPID